MEEPTKESDRKVDKTKTVIRNAHGQRNSSNEGCEEIVREIDMLCKMIAIKKYGFVPHIAALEEVIRGTKKGERTS